MSSRYSNRKIAINNDPVFNEQFEDRGVDFIRQYLTPKFQNISNLQRANIRKEQILWTQDTKYWKLAQQFYGDPAYWWVIAFYNSKPTDAHVAIGDTIYIPMPFEQVISLMGV